MKIHEEHFRNLYKSFVIIKSEKLAPKIARSLQIGSVMEERISNEEFEQRLNSIKIDDKINAIFAIPYIDHTAGISFLTLSVAALDGENADIVRRESFEGIVNFRKNDVNECEFEYLENLNVNADFDIDYYQDHAKIVESYRISDKVEALRFADILDDSRHENFPDDLSVIFIKKDLQMEKMWVRVEGLDEDSLIDATLLNTPYQDFGVEEGDRVKVFPYRPEGSDEWIVICDLN